MLARDGRRGVLGAELDEVLPKGDPRYPGFAHLDGEQVVQVQDALDRRSPVQRERSLEPLLPLRRPLLKGGGHQAVLRPEVGVERGLGGVGRGDDRVDPDLPDAELGEHPVGGLEDPGARYGRLLQEIQITTDRFVSYGAAIQPTKGCAMSTDPYRLRTARPDERDRVQEIEDLAGTRFAGLGLIDESLDVGFPTAELDRLIRAGQVWVACDEADQAVGMVIASVREDAVYVEEMDVLAEHGRRGLGGRLLETVCTWATEHGYAAVTLSTFRDVPWNGPFYRRHGFADLPPAAWTPGMRAIHEQEGRHGLRTDVRVFMQRDLGAATSAA